MEDDDIDEFVSDDPFRLRADLGAGLWRPHLLTSVQELSIRMSCSYAFPLTAGRPPHMFGGATPAAALMKMAKLGVVVLGISTDDVKSHVKFRDKYSLNFPLLADVEHRMAEAYGAWQEKNMYGKKSWGVVRSTFLIDAAGIVRSVWPKVSVEGHDAAVIEAVKQLGTAVAPSAATKPASKKSPVKKAAAKQTAAPKRSAAAKPAPKQAAPKKTPPKKKPAKKK